MTSKEAVLELICEAKSVNIDEKRVCFLRKIIEKDLEVLEILKNIPSIRLKIQEWSEKYPSVTYSNERKIIKEWLENE